MNRMTDKYSALIFSTKNHFKKNGNAANKISLNFINLNRPATKFSNKRESKLSKMFDCMFSTFAEFICGFDGRIIVITFQFSRLSHKIDE